MTRTTAAYRRTGRSSVCLVLVAAAARGRADTSPAESLAARGRLIALVDETLRATADGLRVEPEEPANRADQCTPPGERHNWTYSRYLDVVGERAARLSRDVAAYWKNR